MVFDFTFRFTLTLWHSTSETLLIGDLIEVYKSFPRDKVYYDLPEDLMDDFVQAIEDLKT